MKRRTTPTMLQEKRERLRALVLEQPELTPTMLGVRLLLSHVTVRKLLRELGLYVPRGIARERREVQP